MLSFHNRTALITGAASGIGLATAQHLAAQGANRLILADVDADALAQIDLPCVIDVLPGDVRDEDYWHAAAPRLVGIDAAVINAGVAGAGTIPDLTVEEWRRILSINLDGAFLTLRAVMRAMQTGSIVIVASAAGIKPEPGVAAYGASKAAVIQLAKVAAREAAPNIRVNAIAPAGVETPVWDAVPMFADRAAAIGRDAAFAELAAMATPMGRYAKADEIAAQIGFLLSDAAATITGSVLVSDGGYTL
jgi:2-keto-3-deoxy-L-fuconate dehydrogenase